MAWSGLELKNARFWIEPLQVREVPHRKTKPGLKVGFVGSQRLRTNLEFDCSIYLLTQENYRAVIATAGLDFILFEPTLHATRDEWDVAASGYLDNLSALSQLAEQQGVPLVYWDTLGAGYDSVFSTVWPLFAHRYSADPARASDWRQLPPAIQPALHNPFRHRGDVALFSVQLLFDGMVDISRRAADFKFLDQLEGLGLGIFDSRYTFFPNKLRDLDHRFSRVHGHLPVEMAYKAYKFSRYYLTVSTTQKSSVARLFDSIEAAACGALVLDVGPEHIEGVFAEMFQRIPRDELPAWLENACEEDWSIRRQLNLRTLVLDHSYARRLVTLCRDLGIQHVEEQLPRISIFTPSNRPRLAEKVVEQFVKQTYPNKELVYVYNAAHPESLPDIVRNTPGLQFFSLPPEMNIGSCMNFAIGKATGEFSVKMDDDDFYGENYLLDIFIALKCVMADFWGKPPSYVYFESTEEFYFRVDANRRASPYSFCFAEELDVNSFNIAGNTLGGRRSAMAEHSFSVSNVGAVDTIFHDMSACHQSVVAMLDSGNMAVFRGSDLTAHNWRIEDDALKKNAKLIGVGMSHEKVFY